MSRFYTFDCFGSIGQCRHLVTTKINSMPSLFSMALHTGEDKYQVVQNREVALRHMNPKTNTVCIVANQTHSNHIYIAKDTKSRGWQNSVSAIEDCDALITDKKNTVLAILTADCVPVLLIDPYKNVIAAVHAGWRGSKEQILFKTVEKMCQVFCCDSKNIIAGIGPSISSCCYEVNKDVAKYFKKEEYSPKGDRYMLDLPKINKNQLLRAGLLDEHIEISTICTSCTTDRFFSYRKENGCSGRFMSMICLQ